MDDPVRWLGEQLDTDATRARKAAALCGCHPPAPAWSFRDGDEPTDGRILVVDDPHPTVKRKLGRRWNGSYDGLFMAEFIAEWDPARVLREIDAKRKLLDDHPIVPRDVEPTVVNGEEIGGPYYPFGCGNCHTEADSPEVNGFGYCLTWRVLASVYADRPGYREEWRP